SRRLPDVNLRGLAASKLGWCRAFEQARSGDARRALAARAERLDPDLATTAFIREDRAGKVFLDSTRAGGATVAAAYSPRVRPGVPVSFPVAWEDLDNVQPRDFTVRTAPRLIAARDPWLAGLPEQKLSR